MNELEQRWRDLGEFIREQRRVGHLSLRKLSEMAGISNPYLSQIERGLRKPSAEILQQIARALEISSETLYVRAGILEERDGGPTSSAEIRRDPDLAEEQKKTLIRIYESFRHENEGRSRPRSAGRRWNPWSIERLTPAVPSCAASPSSPCTPPRSPSRARATAGA